MRMLSEIGFLVCLVSLVRGEFLQTDGLHETSIADVRGLSAHATGMEFNRRPPPDLGQMLVKS